MKAFMLSSCLFVHTSVRELWKSKKSFPMFGWYLKGARKMIREAIEKIVRKEDLTYDEAYTVMNEIMKGQTSQTQNAAFLAALSTKSTRAETIAEISGCAAAMRELATPVPHPGLKVLEIVGTGGDRSNTFNISTTSAFVIAAAGVKVAKHGNRAASSKSGTADVQEALGVNIQQSPEKALEMLNGCGMCFLFAQKYHSAMKYVGPIRKELGFRTVFNILGPLTNPANPDYFLLGVYDEYLVEPVAKVLDKLGVSNAVVVHGKDRLDEVSPSAPTTVCELKNGYYRTTQICPEDFGLDRGTKEELVGGTAEENAEITKGVLSGKIQGTKRNAVLMNAGLALYVAQKAPTMQAGIDLAAEMIDSGKAYKTMEAYIKQSNEA
jgi:anthranilate phosphoribosyltransferase